MGSAKACRAFDEYLKTFFLTPTTFKYGTVEPFFRAERFTCDDSDICMVDSDAAENFLCSG